MDLGLGGRGYLLTGASRGLGFATARALVDARSQQSVDAAAKQLGGAPAALGTTADLADVGVAERLAAEAVEQLGRVDGALISVGGPPPGGVFQTSPEQWRAAYDSVVLG